MSEASKSKLPHPAVLLDAEPVLVHHALAHAHRAGRAVVVVVARVLSVDPADEPHVEVGVAVELLVEARLLVVADERPPEVLGDDELGREIGHRRPIEVGVRWNPLADPGSELTHVSDGAHVSKREGVSDWRTCLTASPKPRTASSVGRESTTGVSLP
jgi:hypothetical protein